MWIVLALFAALASAQPASERQREQNIRAAEMLAAANLKPGSRAADIGAGDGFLTARIARLVGTAGKVWALDVDTITAIPALRRMRKRNKLRNVEILIARQDQPSLPAGPLDGAFLVLSYHEITAYRELLRELRRAIRPDGRIVVVDLMPCRTRGLPRPAQAKAHALAPDFAETEFRQAGFEIALRDDHFIDRPEEEQARWMIVLRNPA